MTTFTITQDLCHAGTDYSGRLLNHRWVGLTGRLDDVRGTHIVRLVDPPSGTGTRQWIITDELADRIRALTASTHGDTFTHGGVTYAAGDYVSLTYGGERQVGVLHFEHGGFERGGLKLGEDRIVGSGTIPWVIDGNGLRFGVSDLRKLEQRTTWTVGERAVIVTQPNRGPGAGSVPLTTPLVGAEVTVQNSLIDGDGEVLVSRIDGSRSFYLDPACLRFYAEPGQPTPAPEGDEAASLRAEIARVRAEHEEQMRQLGIRAQLLGRETGMCGVLEKFAEEHGIPFEGVPFRGKITVTYSFEGNASRDWATEEQLTDRFEVSEGGVSFPEAAGYDGRPATRVTSIQVEDTDFDLTIG